MTKAGRSQIFVQRANFRQRRLRDAAKLLPILGALLWLIPLAWPTPGDAGGDTVGAAGLVYVFAVWLILIVVAGVLNMRMRPLDERGDTETRSGP